MTHTIASARTLEETGAAVKVRATEKTTSDQRSRAMARGAMSTRTCVVFLGLRLVLGGVLIVAGATKIGEPTLFASLIDDYRLLPPGWSEHVAVSLPWVEVLVGCCLVAGLWTRSSALVAAGMFSVFVGAMAINVARGVDLSCGCFGVGEDGGEGALWVSLLRSTVLLGVAVALLRQTGVARWSMDALLGQAAETETARSSRPSSAQEQVDEAMDSPSMAGAS